MKTILITGGSSGIGLETARALAKQGYLVISASREKPKTIEIIRDVNADLEKTGAKGKLVFMPLDLMDLISVKEMVNNFVESYPSLDILICNAGIMNAPYRITKDGFESEFQTNFLSHYYLTKALLPTLLKSNNPKVINVCSSSAEKGKIHDVQQLEKISRVEVDEYDAMTSYRESKLAQEITVLYLSRQDQYQDICFSLLNPGVVNTNLYYKNSGPL